MSTDKEFKNLHFQLSKEDIRKLDKWKNSRGMKSRSEAIRSIIRIVTKDQTLEEGLHKHSFSDNADTKFVKHVTHHEPARPQEGISKKLLRDIIKEEIEKILNEHKLK